MNVRTLVHGAVLGLTTVVTMTTAAWATEPVRLYVTIDKAELVNLQPTPISKVAVTNPNIADVYVISPTQILLSGKHAGTTSLMVFYPGRAENFDVVVHPVPVGQSRARLVPSDSQIVEVQRAGKVSQQLFVRDEDSAWVQLGAGTAEREGGAK